VNNLALRMIKFISNKVGGYIRQEAIYKYNQGDNTLHTVKFISSHSVVLYLIQGVTNATSTL